MGMRMVQVRCEDDNGSVRSGTGTRIILARIEDSGRGWGSEGFRPEVWMGMVQFRKGVEHASGQDGDEKDLGQECG
jgi:hypothetical protein